MKDLKSLVKVLDARSNIRVYTDKNTKVFEGNVYQLFDSNENYMNINVEEFFIDFGGTLVVLLSYS